jgi:methylated-DNA-[protein]-cysteine S-methyltransferase
MNNTINIAFYKTRFGELILGSYKQKLCLCDWRYRKSRQAIDERIQSGLKAKYVDGDSEISELTIAQLNTYFKGERTNFEIPLLLVGSDFQKSVWEALLQIPYGNTKTYMELAKQTGNKQTIRAVAAANGANAISIIVPCHRIVGSNGDLVGYAGGIQVKKKLLQLEKAEITSQLDLFQ